MRVEPQRRRGGIHALGDLGAPDASSKPKRERHVLAHRHVRIERVALKDHGDVALARAERR